MVAPTVLSTGPPHDFFFPDKFFMSVLLHFVLVFMPPSLGFSLFCNSAKTHLNTYSIYQYNIM